MVLVISSSAWAHFGMVIPSDTMVMQGDQRSLTLVLSFSHPFEFIGMDMTAPKSFTVFSAGKQIDLTKSLIAAEVMQKKAWQCSYPIKRPGIYVFHMEPQPYWEPAEDCFIVHHTKTVVTAFGDDEGWDAELGIKTEIVPLAKPFGLYAGNVFQGVVKLDGKAVPFAEVEVEYFNAKQRAVVPTDYMVTQTVKADQNGVFTYATPRAGWWGFAALNQADYKLKYQGVEKDVELGAVLWVKFHPWQEN
jgi:cobalt/nickel transport protein